MNFSILWLLPFFISASCSTLNTSANDKLNTIDEFRKMVVVSLNNERTNFQVETGDFMSLASSLNALDHIRILHNSFNICSTSRDSYLHEYLNYIIYIRIPNYLDENPENTEVDWKLELLPVLKRLIKYNYSVTLMELIVIQIFTKLSYKEQTNLYDFAFINYSTFSTVFNRIKLMKTFCLFAQYFPDPLLCPLNKFKTIEATAESSFKQLIFHFGPLIVFLSTSDASMEHVNEIFDLIYHDLFVIDSKPISLSYNMYLFFETILKVIVQIQPAKVLDNLIQRYFASGVLSTINPIHNEIPQEIVYCCSGDLPCLLAHFLFYYKDNLSIDHLQLSYLLVQARRSLDQTIQTILLQHFHIDIDIFNTKIAHLLEICFIEPRIIDILRKIIINLSK